MLKFIKSVHTSTFMDFCCFPSIACATTKGNVMKIRKYRDIAPSNRTNFTMVYYYAGRTLTQLETILKQAYGKPATYTNKRSIESPEI